MASGVGPVLSLDTSINFVLYKLSIANVFTFRWDEGSQLWSSPFPTLSLCPHCSNTQPRNILFDCFVYQERKESATQRAHLISCNSSLLLSPTSVQILWGRNSWMLGIIYLDFPKHTWSRPYYWMQIYTEHITLTSAECTSYCAGALPQTSPKHIKGGNMWRRHAREGRECNKKAALVKTINSCHYAPSAERVSRNL